MITHLFEGMRIFRHSLDRKIYGHKRYKGTARQICLQVVKDCWNTKYFQTSSGHFSQFYARDFGICADALIKLGYAEQARKTVKYALDKYSRKNHIAVAITPNGKPFDFPYYGVDSAAFMARSARATGLSLTQAHRRLLRKEAQTIYAHCIDHETGLVKKQKTLSSMKDYAKRASSCYDNTVLAMLSQELACLGIPNPLKHYKYKRIIRENFWNGSYFLDDLGGSEHVAGDANTIPYWTGLFTERAMLKKSVSAIKQEGLDKPLPLKYTSREVRQKMISYEILVKGWQTDAIWAQLGPIYISLLKKISPEEAMQQTNKYAETIERHGNYMEVFATPERPFRSAFYHSDAGMLWAALFLELIGEKE
ncbi:hypothetical protein HY640_02845 [Candidatus Woesearchaeota archaeon]|nr:hypothetical protein [Candidatus Woesearchaeota archaeon]